MMWLHESRKKSREKGRKNKTEKLKIKKKEKTKRLFSVGQLGEFQWDLNKLFPSHRL